MITDTPTGRY